MLLSLLSRESQLLFLTADSAARGPEILKLLQSNLDWVELSRLADHEKAIPILWRRMVQTGSGTMPADAAAHFRKMARVVSFRMAYLEQLVLNSAVALTRARIDHTFLKGAALGCGVYGSFSERPMVDVDVLVRERDADAAISALLYAGWVRQPKEEQHGDYSKCHHLPPLIDTNNLVSSEVHTSLFPRTAPFGITTDEVLASTQVVSFRGIEVRIPGPSYLLLHACLHLAWIPMFRNGAWRTFRDVKSIISKYDFDWDEFLALARTHRAETSCFWTLHLASELVGAPIPEAVVRALRPRLPAALLRGLERHFAMILLPTTTSCPSVTLRRMLWVAGILPGRSKHGKSRPWQGGILRPEDREAISGRWEVQRAATSRRSWRTWVDYGTGVIGATQTSYR